MIVTARRRAALINAIAELSNATDTEEKREALLTLWDELGHAELTPREVAVILESR